MKKNFLTLFLATVLFSVNLLVPAYAQDEVYAKKVLVNVAQNKPVSSNQTEDSNYPFSNLVDGRNTSFIVPASGMNSARTEITIDLTRKYQIEKIELHSRYDGSADFLGRQYFELIGANKIDFSDGVVIDYLNEQNDEVFPSSGCFTSKSSNNAAYRYVKLKRTGGGYYGYSEIKVFAYQTVTEVSRNKTVTTNEGSAIAGEKAVNGTNAHASDGWVNDRRTEYNYLSVDLGDKYPIGMIEMEGRNITSENSATRQNIEVYGSDSIDNMPELTSKARLSESDGYKPYFYIGAIGGYYVNDTFPYSKYPDMFQTVVDDSEPFQFVTFRNTTLHASAYGEVRAYVINPEILNVNYDDNFIYVEFSDEMKDNLSNSFILTSGEDTFDSLEISMKDDYTYKIDISSLNKNSTYKLCVLKTAENIKGVALAEDYEVTLKSLNPVFAENITYHSINGESDIIIESFYGEDEIFAKTTVVNNSKENKNVGLFVAFYDSFGRVVSVSKKDETIDYGEEKEVLLPVEITDEIKESNMAKAFIWDLTEENIMPISDSSLLYCDRSNIYVSPMGNDENSGTKNAPFETLERAKTEVRNRTEDMNEDINVNLYGGVYNLTETLLFDEKDSGKNGCYVNYKAVENESVLISGGKKIEGFELCDEEQNIYSAYLPDVEDIRNMYVNGISARTARSEERIKPISIYYEGDVPKGLVVSEDDVPLYENPSDIRLFYTQVWKYTLCNAQNIIPAETEGQNIIIMEEDAFSIAADSDTYLPITSENAFYIENAKELLDKPGEFYFDKTEKMLYYMAEETEIMEKAEVYVPVLDKLMELSGSDLDKKVKNISFSGIHFAHATGFNVEKGYLGGQAQSKTPIANATTAYPLDTTITGGNIRVLRAENIVFENNKFSGLSSVALGIYEGSNDITVRGNAFYDIGDSAVTVGLPSDSYMEDAYLDENGNYLGRNVALYKPAKNINGAYVTEATDGDSKTVWTTNYISSYLQIDLGKEYEISQIRIPARKNYGTNSGSYDSVALYRRNFKIEGSKYEDFSDGGTLLGQQGSAAFDAKEGFISNTNTKEKFRYIRVSKTVNEHFPLADVLVISPEQTAPLKEVSKKAVIDNNYITRVGEFNLGAPGVQLYYTEDAIVSHNVIKDVPYSGICVGWGWLNTLDSTTAKNNKILNNHIENYAMRTYDAGGVYLLGTQSGNVVEGNYMKNQPNAYYALYSDSGSENFVAKNNVFSKVLMSFAIGTSYEASGKKNLTIQDNYSTTPYCTVNYTDTNSVVEKPTVFIESDVPQAAVEIINNAGLKEEYSYIANGIPSGRWTLSTEDIYGDIIDHHLVTEGSYSGESMPDTTLISYYLSSTLQEANKTLELGRDKASADDIDAFETAIKKATAEETQFKNLGYGYNNTTKAPIDRKRLIDVRVELLEAINAFVENMM